LAATTHLINHFKIIINVNQIYKEIDNLNIKNNLNVICVKENLAKNETIGYIFYILI
jgi:hypothetical protein